MKKLKQLVWNLSQDKNNLEFYLEFVRKGIPLPKEWLTDCERLTKRERDLI